MRAIARCAEEVRAEQKGTQLAPAVKSPLVVLKVAMVDICSTLRRDSGDRAAARDDTCSDGAEAAMSASIVGGGVARA